MFFGLDLQSLPGAICQAQQALPIVLNLGISACLGLLGRICLVFPVHAKHQNIAKLAGAGAYGTVPRDPAYVVHAADRGAEEGTGTALHG